VAVFCAASGVEPQSENVWRQADKHHVPKICFVNKMDRQGADFISVIDQMRNKLGANPVALQMPIGSEDQFEGIIDLLEMKAVYWTSDDGTSYQSVPIPNELKADAEEMRSQLLEKIAEVDEQFLEAYLDNNDLSELEIRQALRRATLER